MYDDQQQPTEFGTFVVQSNSTAGPSSYGGGGRGGGGGGGRHNHRNHHQRGNQHHHNNSDNSNFIGGGGGGGYGGGYGQHTQPAEFSGLHHGAGGAIPNPQGYGAYASQQQQTPMRGATNGGASPSGISVSAGGSGAPTSSSSEDVYEVHDNQLKAPVSIHRMDVIPTAGSHRLFSAPPQQLNAPGQSSSMSRNAPRICEPYQHGQCVHGEECPDVHVALDVLTNMRTEMMNWLLTKEAEFRETAMQSPETTFRVFAADLKEVVDVPILALSFTRGLYVDPSARAKRSRYGQQSAFALMAAQVPTACGLHSVDPSQCKWGRWCNQAHIDPLWMRIKRGEFENWSRSLEQQYEDMPDEHVFVVHDPQTKASLQIPKMAIAGFSRGLFQGNLKKAPSVCMLFQRGRCTAGTCCNQIHVFPEYLVLLRQYMGDGNPELLFAMQQVALQQKEMLLAQQAQQQQFVLMNAQLGGGGGGVGGGQSLNPSARPFVPPGSGGGGSGGGGGAFQGYGVDATTGNFVVHVLDPSLVAQYNGGMMHPLLQQQQQQQQPFPVEQSSNSVNNFAPTSSSGAPQLSFSTDVDTASSMKRSGSSTQPSPLMMHAKSPVLGAKVGPVLPSSPPAKSGISALADLRSEEDEIFYSTERKRQQHHTQVATPSSQLTPTTPLKQNNPYQTGASNLKPIGVPPSPLHQVSLPPPMSASAIQQQQQQQQGHLPSAGASPLTSQLGNSSTVPPWYQQPQQHHNSYPYTSGTNPNGSSTTYPSQMDRSIPHTPPMQFGWVPQARVPPMNSLPPPPSPYRSQALKTPTSPPYPAPFTPDLSHMQFSPSPLLRSAESMTHMPKNMSLDGFDEIQHQHHAAMSMSMSASMLPGSSSSAAYHGLPPSHTGGTGSTFPLHGTNHAVSPPLGAVRQGQPYQQPQSQQGSSASSSTPSRLGNGTPVDQR